MKKDREAEGREDQMQDEKLEDIFAALEEVIARMEDPSASLEDTFQNYEKGVRLLKTCNEKIDRVEKQVLALSEEGSLHEFQ